MVSLGRDWVIDQVFGDEPTSMRDRMPRMPALPLCEDLRRFVRDTPRLR